jgi:hypothetical protein
MGVLAGLADVIDANSAALNLPGVLAVRPGFIEENGWPTKARAIVVIKSPSAPAPSVPAEVAGIPVQVRDADDVELYAANNPANYACRVADLGRLARPSAGSGHRPRRCKTPKRRSQQRLYLRPQDRRAGKPELVWRRCSAQSRCLSRHRKRDCRRVLRNDLSRRLEHHRPEAHLMERVGPPELPVQIVAYFMHECRSRREDHCGRRPGRWDVRETASFFFASPTSSQTTDGADCRPPKTPLRRVSGRETMRRHPYRSSGQSRRHSPGPLHWHCPLRRHSRPRQRARYRFPHRR